MFLRFSVSPFEETLHLAFNFFHRWSHRRRREHSLLQKLSTSCHDALDYKFFKEVEPAEPALLTFGGFRK